MKKLIIILMIFFTSCSYKDYTALTDEYEAGKYINDRTQFSFFKFYKIYQPAKGLAAFPDGGQPKILYQGVFVYLYDIPSNTLRMVHSFGALKGNRSSWKDWIYFDEKNQLFFNISPSAHYKFYHSTNNSEIYNASKGIFSYNIENSKISRISDKAESPQVSPNGKSIAYTSYLSSEPEIYLMDKTGQNDKFMYKGFQPTFSPNGNYLSFIYESDSVMYDIKVANIENGDLTKIKTIKNINKYSVFWLNNKFICFDDVDGTHNKFDIESKEITDNNVKKVNTNFNKISIREIKEFTKNVTYPEWGIRLHKCCPKSKKEIIEVLVNPKKGNENYLKAILQEIENELSKNDIHNLLKLIEEKTNKLETYEKAKYERHTKETVERLNKLLEVKK